MRWSSLAVRVIACLLCVLRKPLNDDLMCKWYLIVPGYILFDTRVKHSCTLLLRFFRPAAAYSSSLGWISVESVRVRDGLHSKEVLPCFDRQETTVIKQRLSRNLLWFPTYDSNFVSRFALTDTGSEGPSAQSIWFQKVVMSENQAWQSVSFAITESLSDPWFFHL